MNPWLWGKFLLFWHAELFSPAGFVQRAIVISVGYLLVHLAGLREYTSVLNGTVGPESAGWTVSAILGITYIIIYLAFVVLVPVLLLAAGILALWQRRGRRMDEIKCSSGATWAPPRH
jgi:hypothetical protein